MVTTEFIPVGNIYNIVKKKFNVYLIDMKMWICGIYRPWFYNFDKFVMELENILTINSKVKTILIRDFNINLINKSMQTSSYFIMLVLNDFKIYNKIDSEYTTRQAGNLGTIIDQVLSNKIKECNITDLDIFDHKII